MQLEQASVMAMLSSSDEKKQIAALMLLRRDSAVNNATAATLAPFIVQKFLVPRIALKDGGSAHYVQKKLAYALLRGVPLFGAPWVSMANSIDCDVQEAYRTTETDNEVNLCRAELAVVAMRTIAALPYTHINDYVRSRWDSMLAILSHSRNDTLRLAILHTITALCRAAPGAEQEERASHCSKLLAKSRFSEHFRRLIVDPSDDICAAAWRLLQTCYGKDTASSSSSIFISPLPAWLVNAIGFTDDTRRDCVDRTVKLNTTHQQAALEPLTALCLSADGTTGAALVLTLVDAIIIPTLNGSWNASFLFDAACVILSAVVKLPALLLSLCALISQCSRRIVSVVTQPVPGDMAMKSIIANPAAASSLNDPATILKLINVLESLFSLTTPHDQAQHLEALVRFLLGPEIEVASGVPSTLGQPSGAVLCGVAMLTAQLWVRLAADDSSDSIGEEVVTDVSGVDLDDDEVSPLSPSGISPQSKPKPFESDTTDVTATCQRLFKLVAAVGRPFGGGRHSNCTSSRLLTCLFAVALQHVRKAVDVAGAGLPSPDGFGSQSHSVSSSAVEQKKACPANAAAAVTTAILLKVVEPCIKSPILSHFAWKEGLLMTVGTHPSLCAILEEAAKLLCRSCPPLEGEDPIERELYPPIALSPSKRQVLSDAIDLCATAMECSLPSLAPLPPVMEGPDQTAAAAVPLSTRISVLRMLHTIGVCRKALVAVGATNTLRSKLFDSLVCAHAAMPVANAMVLGVLALGDPHSAATLPKATDATVVQHLLACACTFRTCCTYPDKEHFHYVRTNPSYTPPPPQDEFETLRNDIAEFTVRFLSNVNTSPFVQGMDRSLLEAMAAVLIGGKIISTGKIAPIPSALQPKTLLNLHSFPRNSSIPIALSCAGLPLPPTDCLGFRRIRSHVVSGPGDLVHVTLTYYLVSPTMCEVAATIVNRTPVVLSQVNIDITKVQSPSSLSPLMFHFIGQGQRTALGGALTDCHSPAASSNVTASGNGQYTISALTPHAHATVFALYICTAADPVQPVEASNELREYDMASMSSSATLGAFSVNVTAIGNPDGEVDATADATVQRRHDADSLMAYLKKKKKKKKEEEEGKEGKDAGSAAGLRVIALHTLDPLPISLRDCITPIFGSFGRVDAREICESLAHNGWWPAATAGPIHVDIHHLKASAADAPDFSQLFTVAEDPEEEITAAKLGRSRRCRVAMQFAAGSSSHGANAVTRHTAHRLGRFISVEAHYGGTANNWVFLIRSNVPALAAAVAQHSEWPVLASSILKL